eukprot:1315322-Alexandrium_andersonii.AAC.1
MAPMASLAGPSCTRIRTTCCPGAAVRPTVGAVRRHPAGPVRSAPAMTCLGTLRPSAPQRRGRPMNSSSSN